MPTPDVRSPHRVFCFSAVPKSVTLTCYYKITTSIEKGGDILILHSEHAFSKAEKIIKRYGTRDAILITEELGIIVFPRKFKNQKAAYTVIEHNRYIFIKEDLDPVTYNLILLHEIGHDVLHRKEAIARGGFHEKNPFDLSTCRMEHEANLFAAHISLPDDELDYYVGQGYSFEQIARIMQSDPYLVKLKLKHR